jgi:dephospho-CoA kinase
MGAMHLFGLTGGIASGKSTVGARFRARGVPVIDADEVARAVVAKGTEGLAAVVAAFGGRVLADDGSLDRKVLGNLVFADPRARATLNGITHPRVAVETAARQEALAAAGHPIACYEAALLIELGLADAFRPLVVVDLPRPIQEERLCSRDGIDRAEASRRIDAQATPKDRRAAADYLLTNIGPREELLADADATLNAITDRLGLPRQPAVA